jgi:hypothetical protein
MSESKNRHKLTIAATATAIALALAIAPLLSLNAYAVKTVTPEECVGDPQDRATCPGASGGTNPNREQQECQVTGGGDQTVQGQQKKICG